MEARRESSESWSEELDWAKRSKILVYVVDDESIIGELVGFILERQGIRSKFFTDPEMALDSLTNDEEKPVLLLTDYLMRPMTGMELIARCKEMELGLKTVLFSGAVGKEILQYYPASPDGFLAKPFLPESLVDTVEFFLEEFTYATPCDGEYMFPEPC